MHKMYEQIEPLLAEVGASLRPPHKLLTPVPPAKLTISEAPSTTTYTPVVVSAILVEQAHPGSTPTMKRRPMTARDQRDAGTLKRTREIGTVVRVIIFV